MTSREATPGHRADPGGVGPRTGVRRTWPRLNGWMVLAWAAALIFAVPLLYALYISLIDQSNLFGRGSGLAPLTLDNYVRVWTLFPFPRYS